MPDNASRFLRRTRAVAALPGRFTAFEHRQGAVDDHLVAALEAVAAAAGQLGDDLNALRAETATEVQAVRVEVEVIRAELEAIREELTTIRRLVEGRLEVETESVALVGQLLQRAETRLEALEQQQA